MARRRRHPHEAASAAAARRRRAAAGGSDAADGDATSRLKPRPLQRNAANARERARMRVLSRAFSRLKTSLPWVPEDTKLSKLDTLRLAAGYIAHLRRVLVDDDEASSPSSATEEVACGSPRCLHPLTLTWPFSFHQRLPSPEGQDSEPKVRHAVSCRMFEGDASLTSSNRPAKQPCQEPAACHGGHRYSSAAADDGFDSFLDYLNSSSGPSHPSYSGRFMAITSQRPMCSS
ncbi:musculin [Dermacentor silvarum]|uniref:musculin n=1 Tax=Dermacentor silvarum TaxID=543639 RepID=UPI00189BC34A|nr:musculin [Dermacentor silvarum]